MADAIISAGDVSLLALIRGSFRYHLKPSKIAFSLFIPAVVQLQKQIKEKEKQKQPIETDDVFADFRRALYQASGNWLTGLLGCSIHTTIAVCLSQLRSVTADRILFLYSVQPKMVQYFTKVLLKKTLPACLAKRIHPLKALNHQEAAYVTHNNTSAPLQQRLGDSVLRRGLYLFADFAARVLIKCTSLKLYIPTKQRTETRVKLELHPVLYCAGCHGGALCFGVLGAFVGGSCASNKGEFWGEFIATTVWLKSYDRFFSM